MAEHAPRLTTRTDRARAFMDATDFRDALSRGVDLHRALLEHRCAGREFLGWLDLPDTARAHVPDIDRAAARLRERADVLVVIGIGGSSLGTRAALQALGHPCDERVPASTPSVVFAGHHLSADTLAETLHGLDGRRIALNVVSKSGTTTEPGIAFRILLEHLRRAHPTDWAARVVATTDPNEGALRSQAREQGWTTFDVPPDVGGRFSVLSPVGLFPLAFAGVDVGDLLDGAADVRRDMGASTQENEAIAFAATRHALYRAGFVVDVLSFTSPRLRALGAWWQQLFGESEGKNHRGPWPGTCELPADLHSLGQTLQDGRRQVAETILRIADEATRIAIPSGDPRDGLDYLRGKTLRHVLDAAVGGTIDAHTAGGVPVLELLARDTSAGSLGALFYFFQVVVAVSGLLLDVNPFDQPGVEAYKRNMFARLGRP